MSELHNKKCIACDGSIPAFDVEEIHKYLKKVDGWDVLQNQEKNYYIEKNFKFTLKKEQFRQGLFSLLCVRE